MLFQALHKFLTQDLMWQSDLWYINSPPPVLSKASRPQSLKHQDSQDRQTYAPSICTGFRLNHSAVPHMPTPGQSLGERERDHLTPPIYLYSPLAWTKGHNPPTGWLGEVWIVISQFSVVSRTNTRGTFDTY